MDPTPYVIFYFESMLVIYLVVFVLLILEKFLVVRRPA